jgi:hypothetical protein
MMESREGLAAMRQHLDQEASKFRGCSKDAPKT